jgi:hypothetical protein
MKLFESLLYYSFISFVTSNNIIPDSRHALRAGTSTLNQLIDLIHTISIDFNDNSLICVNDIFIDYSNAFDSLYHSQLIFDLKSMVSLAKC